MCRNSLKKVELIIKIMTFKVLKNDKTELQIWVLRMGGKKAGWMVSWLEFENLVLN